MHKHTDNLKLNALRVRIERQERQSGTGRIQILPTGAEDEGAWRETDRESVAALWRLLLLCGLVCAGIVVGAIVWAFSLRGGQ